MKQANSIEQVNVRRFPDFNNMELLRARYLVQNFTPHMHEHFALGVIEAGALRFDYRCRTFTAPAGSVNLCIAGELHTGHSAGSEGWAYRMIYFDPEVLHRTACEICGHPTSMPYFEGGVINDETLAYLVRRLHIRLEQGNIPVLEKENCFDQVLTRLITCHAQRQPELRPTGREVTAVMRIRDYLEMHYTENVTSADLCQVVNLSRFHLNRVFSQTVGIPPYAYLRQVRINQAKKLLARGESIAWAAVLTGFADQSHFTRWFKRQCGFTPGEYSNSVQYK